MGKDEENLKRSSLDSFFISKEEKQMKKEQNDFLQKIENKMINGKTNNKNDTKKAEKISKEYLNAMGELYNGNKKYTTNKLDNIFAIKSDSVVEENTVSEDKNKISTSEETVSEDKSEKTLSKKVEKAPKKNKLNIFKLIKEKNLGYEQIRKLDINKEAKCLNNKIIKDEIPIESLSKIETNSQIKKKIPKESSTKKETNSQIKKIIPEESSTKNETNSQIKKKIPEESSTKNETNSQIKKNSIEESFDNILKQEQKNEKSNKKPKNKN